MYSVGIRFPYPVLVDINPFVCHQQVPNNSFYFPSSAPNAGWFISTTSSNMN